MSDPDYRIACARLEAANQWIPVTERLPPDGLLVLAYRKRCDYGFRRDGQWIDTLYGGVLANGPTHWMPLPAPPTDANSVVGEPVAWAVVLNAIEAISMNGGATYRVTASKDEAESIAAHAMAVVPLYERQPPTLTDAEREAVLDAALAYESDPDEWECAKIAATLRGLLERTK